MMVSLKQITKGSIMNLAKYFPVAVPVAQVANLLPTWEVEVSADGRWFSSDKVRAFTPHELLSKVEKELERRLLEDDFEPDEITVSVRRVRV